MYCTQVIFLFLRNLVQPRLQTLNIKKKLLFCHDSVDVIAVNEALQYYFYCILLIHNCESFIVDDCRDSVLILVIMCFCAILVDFCVTCLRAAITRVSCAVNGHVSGETHTCRDDRSEMEDMRVMFLKRWSVEEQMGVNGKRTKSLNGSPTDENIAIFYSTCL